MIKFVNAKINIGLNILRRRPDGYHELSTLFYPVGLFNGLPENPEPFCDILEITPLQSGSESGEFAKYLFSGRQIDCPPEKNLVVRATNAFYSLLQTREGTPIPVTIQLEKHLPDGAGLGGGSADASFTLMALNELHDYPFSEQTLIRVATQLGADCPFFIRNTPVIAGGIGEIMKPVPLDLSGYRVKIIKPDIYISTREAFAGITPRTPEVSIEEIVRHPVYEWRERGLVNDFEESIFAKHPELARIKASLYADGAEYAAMSGSGSAIFGLFPTDN